MNPFFDNFAGHLSSWLADYFLVTSLVLFATFLAWRCIRQPVHRIAVAWMAMLQLLLLAIVCAMPFWPRISLLASPPSKTDALVTNTSIDARSEAKRQQDSWKKDASRASGAPTDELSRLSKSQSAAPLASRHVPWTWQQLLLVGFLTGTAVMACWLCWGAVAAWRISLGSCPADEPISAELARIVPSGSRPPRLLVSSRVANAVALGVLRPTIVLPGELAAKQPSSALRVVLRHECAHVRHRDLWLLALGRFLLPLLFAHPLFWWLRRAIRIEQELLADAFAAGEDRLNYAEELLQLVRHSVCPSPSALATVGIWEGPSQLTWRIAMLLDETFHIQTTGSRQWKLRALAAMMILGAACSLVTLTPAQSAEKKNDNEKTAAAKEQGQSTKELAPMNSDRDGPADAQSTKEEATKTGTGSSKSESSATTTNVGTITMTATEDVKCILSLPGCEMLARPKVLAEMKLTDDQKKSLQAIHEKFSAADRNFHKEAAEIEKKHPLTKEEIKSIQKRYRELRKETGKQVETIFTIEQSKYLQDLRDAQNAYWHVPNVETMPKHGVADLTKEQKDKILSMREQIESDVSKQTQEAKQQIVAVFAPEQRAKLQETMLSPEGNLSIQETTVHRENQSYVLLIPTLAPYADFSLPETQKELSLTEDQLKRVGEILGGNKNLTDKLVQEMEKLPPKEQNRIEKHQMGTLSISSSWIDLSSGRIGTLMSEEDYLKSLKEERNKAWEARTKPPIIKLSIELRKQFEAALTPEQLAKYKELAFHDIYYTQVNDPLVFHLIDASSQQENEVQRLMNEIQEKSQEHSLETGKTLLNLLTPQQQANFRKATRQEQ